MKLIELLEGVEVREVRGPLAVEIAAVSYNSRQIQPGGLFVAVRGEKVDGNAYVAEAMARGSIAVVSEKSADSDVISSGRSWVQVRSPRRALAQIAAHFHGHPSRSLRLVGVTGTNGKTTTAYLLQSILRAAAPRSASGGDGPVGLFGTVEYHTARGVRPADNTTPESLDLQRFLAELREAGASWAVMEVSSHGLELERVHACRFEAAVFTNLARDHLDFHQTMDNYFHAKTRLFLGTGEAPPPLAVLNADEPRSQELRRLCCGRVVLFSAEGKADAITVRQPQLDFSGTEFTLATPTGALLLRSPLVGRANLSNLLAAATTAYALGVPGEAIASGIAALARVPGRFERIDAGQPFAVVVDFAHTDLAFTRLLETARELAGGHRVIIVFGSGGDRDRSKRPLMGEIAARLADLMILTTDNPRSEDPRAIIDEVLAGVRRAQGNYRIELDREQAFSQAFASARPGDVVLLAGKGHQTTQIFGDRVEPWSESEVARRLLARSGFVSSSTRPARNDVAKVNS